MSQAQICSPSTASANGIIPNVGEQHICIESSDGLSFTVRMQSAEVSRFILSVMKLAEGGNDVVFRQDGGTARNRATGKVTEFVRKHGVYVLRAWLLTNPSTMGNAETGFAQQA